MSIDSFAILKKFCHQEGLLKPRAWSKDTNNGFFAHLEVSLSKTEIIYTKTKWAKTSVISKEKIFNLLAYEFLESVGAPLANSSYWLTSGLETNSRPKKPRIAKPKNKLPLDSDPQFDQTLDDALDEALAADGFEEIEDLDTAVTTAEGGEASKETAHPMMAAMAPFLKMFTGGKDPRTMFDSMTTQEGLANLGVMLQHPEMSKMLSQDIKKVIPSEIIPMEAEPVFEVVDSSDSILLSQSTASLGETESK